MVQTQATPYSGFHSRTSDAGVSTLQALLVYSIVKYQPSEYGSYRFPAWAELLGILMGLLSCLMIPAGMLVAVLREEGSLWEVSPPSLPAYRALWPGSQLRQIKTKTKQQQKPHLYGQLFRTRQDSCSLQGPHGI